MSQQFLTVRLLNSCTIGYEKGSLDVTSDVKNRLRTNERTDEKKIQRCTREKKTLPPEVCALRAEYLV